MENRLKYVDEKPTTNEEVLRKTGFTRDELMRVAMLNIASYHLVSLFTYYSDEIDDLFQKHNLMRHEIKYESSRMNKAATNYLKAVDVILCNKDEEHCLTTDFTNLLGLVNRFFRMEDLNLIKDDMQKTICKNSACRSKYTCKLYWAWIDGKQATDKETISTVKPMQQCEEYEEREN